MKKTVFARILTVVVALAITFAAWMPTLAAEETPPVFLLGFIKGEETVGCSAFYVQDIDGNTYLVTASVTDVLLQEDYEPLLIGVDYAQRAEYIGTHEQLSFYRAEGLERVRPLEIAQEIPEHGVIYTVIIEDNEVSEVDSVDGFPMVGDDWEEDDEIRYLPYSEVVTMQVGAPILNDEEQAVACATMTTKGEFAYVALKWAEFPAEYSFFNMGVSQEPAQQEPAAEQQPTQQEPVSQEPAQQEPVQQEPAQQRPVQEQPKKSVPWGLILIVAGVVAIGFVAAKSAKQKSDRTKAKSSVQDGTIALNVMKESPVKENKPAMDSITVENIVINEPAAASAPVQQYDAAPVAKPQWQVRGIGGELNGFVYLLRDRLSFGRDPQCEVAFKADARGISGMHCELVLENGRVQLSDLQSAYGTFLAGGVRLEPRVRYDLNSGDEFTLANGGQTFRLEPVGTVEREQPLAVRSVPGGEVTHADVNGEILFGRDMRCRIKFEESESAVSGMHCKLYYGSDGKLYLMDLDSTNGTFLSERERLRPNVPYRVRKGQAFYLAAPRYTYVVIEE